MAAVQLPDRNQIEEIDDGAPLRDGGIDIVAGGEVNDVGSGGGEESPNWSGQADAGVFVRAGRILLLANESAEAGNEHGRRGANAVTAELIDVAHLVDINRDDEAEREFPAPDIPIDREGEEHREKCARFGEAKEEQLGFGEEKERDEFELPDEQTNDAKDSATIGPAWLFRRLGGGWIFEALDEIVYFGVDGQVLGGGGRKEFEHSTPMHESFRIIAGSSGGFGIRGERF